MKTQLSFYECEHYGDLDNYIDDVEQSGGTVTSSNINLEAETGTIDVTHDEGFWDRFKETNSFEFLN